MIAHLVAKYKRDGKSFYLWQNTVEGYNYTITENDCQPAEGFQPYIHKSLEEVMSMLDDCCYVKQELLR